MITQNIAAVLFALVIAGVFIQVLAVAWVGGRIARVRMARRVAKWRKCQPKPSAVATRRPALALLMRRRCRDYRTALRTAKA